MPRRNDIESILIIGAGPIVIGQACEFDYSGTQAVKALKEDGYKVILVNSNPATIMTDPEFAHRETRQTKVLEEFARYFGKQAFEAVGYVEKDWATDPFSTGCITPLTPGILSESGPALRERTGRIHWAGTETAEAWCGFMDGAVRSGERAAAEILATFRARKA